jgi:hypothetical protein
MDKGADCDINVDAGFKLVEEFSFLGSHWEEGCVF